MQLLVGLKLLKEFISKVWTIRIQLIWLALTSYLSRTAWSLASTSDETRRESQSLCSLCRLTFLWQHAVHTRAFVSAALTAVKEVRLPIAPRYFTFLQRPYRLCALSARIQQPGHKAWSYTSTPLCIFTVCYFINPLKPELNPICYFLALLGAHHFLYVSRIRVKSLTFRLLMSYIYIYGAPILDVSRSHTTTQHSR